MSQEFGMDTPFHGAAGDTVTGIIGAAVAAASWFQVISGLESVIIGALTIVLISVRISRHLKDK